MRPIGEIVLLQVQVASLKVGQSPQSRYDPDPLRAVPRLRLTGDGVAGLTEEGETLPDVHNRTHPASKNRRGSNGISVGFAAHYAAMRDRFGDHLTDGIAGENILVGGHDGMLTEDELRDGLVIETPDGLVPLEQVIVAAPCVEFARYALRFPDDQRPDRTVTEAVRFLDHGVRGFYAAVRRDATIAVGMRVGLPESPTA